MNIKLVAIDLDGTLLDSNKCVCESACSLIEQKSGEGIDFAIATGRTLVEVGSIIDKLPSVHYAIFANGATLVDLKAGNILHQATLCGDDVRAVYDKLSSFDMIFELYVNGEIFSPDWAKEMIDDYGIEKFRRLIEVSRSWCCDIEQVLDRGKEKTEKINIFFPTTEERDKAYQLIKDMPYNITYQLSANLEINSKKADKGYALEELAKHMGLESSNVMAIGDNMNDIKMLKYASFSVAMYNAIDEVKHSANYFTKSNDEQGVAFALKHFLR